MKRKILAILIFFSASLNADLMRAAFDVGSGQTKITIAAVEEGSGRPTQILFAEETVVLVGHDFKKNKNGMLSDKILDDLEKVLRHYRDLTLQYGVKELAGVATAVFRESKNGAAFIQKMREELGIALQVITQAEEGRIGFMTAVAASGKDASDVISWDSGGASFQIATKKDVYEGPWGASKVLAAMVEKVQGKDFTKVQTANPATLSDAVALRNIIQNTLKPSALQHPKKTVVAIGGPYSPFKMAAIALDKTIFTKEEIWMALTQLLGHSDEELAALFPEPEMVIPRLTLIYTVMDHFDMAQFQYCATTGSTLGILMSPQFWVISGQKREDAHASTLSVE